MPFDLANVVTEAVNAVRGFAATASFQVSVEPYIQPETGDFSGRRDYGTAFAVPAVWAESGVFVAPDGGAASTDGARLQILAPCMVRVQDRVTLPDGRRPQVQGVSGPINPQTGMYFAPEVTF